MGVSLQDVIEIEKKKCEKDSIYMFMKYGKIEHPTKGKILFNLYPFQKKTLTEIKKYKLNIINKSRQMGISTLVAAHAVDKMLHNESFKVLVIAVNQDVAKNIVDKVKVLFNGLPVWLKAKVKLVNSNKTEVIFDNGSKIKAVASSGTAGRSEAVSLLIIDEAAHIVNISDIWTSAQSTLATGGDAIVLSTPNGVGNWFHKQCQIAQEKVPDEDSGMVFNYIELPWQLHPERDQEWRDSQTALLGERESAQECDCSFITSGNSLVEGEILEWYNQNYVTDPLEKRGPAGDFWIWKYPDYTKQYVVAVDVARGDGEDDSVIDVYDVEDMEQVAQYVGKIDTTTLGHMAVTIATDYNKAYLIIDNKNIGWDTVQIPIDMKYDNLHYSFRDDQYVDEMVSLRKRYDLKGKEDKVPGFTTTTKNRPMIISKIQIAFRNRDVIIRSKRTINQMFSFIWMNGKPQAAHGYNDDCVMTCGYFLYVRDTALRIGQLGRELTRSSIRAISRRRNIPNGYTSQNYANRYSNDPQHNWLLDKR